MSFEVGRGLAAGTMSVAALKGAWPSRFRTSNGRITSYLATRDFHMEHPHKFPITEIVIGPGA